MIIDTFERGSSYALGPLWNKIFAELKNIAFQSNTIKDGRMALGGGPAQGSAYANVESYEPKQRENAMYESHNVMADIQVVLEGDEYLDMFSLCGSEKESLRDDERDLVFYGSKPDASVRIHLRPGIFALILPGEAHMPCLKANSSHVRKLVVKIPADQLLAPYLAATSR